MLSPASYPTPDAVPELIHVAALRCIGWSVADVARALAAASQLGAGIHAIDTGETFSAGMLHPGLLQALASLDEVWRRGQTEDGRSAAAAVIAAKAEKARRAKIEAARPLWAKPSSEISSVEICLMPDPEDREIIREPHPEVVRWLDTLCPWPADKPFPLTPLEAWYVMQGYTVAPAARITLEDMLQMPGKLEGGDGGIMLWNP